MNEVHDIMKIRIRKGKLACLFRLKQQDPEDCEAGFSPVHNNRKTNARTEG